MLTYVDVPPISPYLPVGTARVDFPRSLASAAVVPFLRLGLSKTVADAWAQVYARFEATPELNERLSRRKPQEDVLYTVDVSQEGPWAILTFYI